MNRFTGPAAGPGHSEVLHRFSPYWNADVHRVEQTLEVEVGERVAKRLLWGMGENTIGAGYEYLRRICITTDARIAHDSQAPRLGQMSLEIC